MGYGTITSYALMSLEPRGTLFVTPGMEVSTHIISCHVRHIKKCCFFILIIKSVFSLYYWFSAELTSFLTPKTLDPYRLEKIKIYATFGAN